MTSSHAPGIGAARDEILARIGEAAARAGRDPAAVEIVAVTKTVPVERIREAVTAGFRSFGENRVQERAAKASELEAAASYPVGEAPRWHLVGPLQSNKARAALELFDVIQTVDSVELARRLDRLASEIRPGQPYPVLLQVNVDADAAKSGFEPADLERDLREVVDLAALSVMGLMTVGRQVEAAEAARPTFIALRAFSERLRARDDRLGPTLSMGMSDDYAVAVEEGATLVRIGSAIFGARPTR